MQESRGMSQENDVVNYGLRAINYELKNHCGVRILAIDPSPRKVCAERAYIRNLWREQGDWGDTEYPHGITIINRHFYWLRG